jgi:hypothetical protein
MDIDKFWKLDDSECDPFAPSPVFTDGTDKELNLYGTFPVLIPKRPPSRLQPPKADEVDSLGSPTLGAKVSGRSEV